MTDNASPSGGVVAPAPKLSVVIPAYNEEARLEAGFEHLQHAIDAKAIAAATTEFLIVDDGSADATTDTALKVYASLPHVRVITLDRHAGKGAAVRAGVKEASGDVVIFTDADMAMDPVQIPILVGKIAMTDLAVGARTLPGSEVDHYSARRNLEGRVFNVLVNIVTGVHLSDTQCGFKAFRTPIAKVLFHFSLIDGFAFDVEVLRSARLLGVTIGEIPVRWSNIRGSRVRPFSDPFSMMKDVVRCRFPKETVPGIAGVTVERELLRSPEPIFEALGRATPVIGVDGGHLVLFPMHSPSELDAACARLADEVGAGSLQPQMLVLDDLVKRAPLRWISPKGCEIAQPTPSGT